MTGVEYVGGFIGEKDWMENSVSQFAQKTEFCLLNRSTCFGLGHAIFRFRNGFKYILNDMVQMV